MGELWQSWHVTWETRLHVLRHFSVVAAEDRALLAASGVAASAMDAAVAMAGSKFAPQVGGIDAWLRLLGTRGPDAQRPQLDGCVALEWDLEQELPGGAGHSALMQRSSLTAEERGRITAEKRDDTEVPIVVLAALPPTHRVTVLARVEEGKARVLTMYPGGVAMPLPSPSLAAEGLDAAVAFWEAHVLVRVAGPVSGR